MFSLWLWDGIEIRPVAVRTNQILVSLTVPDDAMRECDRMRAILLPNAILSRITTLATKRVATLGGCGGC
jgi:hypothetical protein